MAPIRSSCLAESPSGPRLVRDCQGCRDKERGLLGLPAVSYWPMRLLCVSGVALVLAGCIQPMAPDEAAARAVFERYVTLGVRDAPALAELYADDALIRIHWVFASGKTDWVQLDGAQWKRNIVKLSSAPSHAPSSTFSHVTVHRHGERMLIMAHRYSPSTCRTDEGYSMIVDRDSPDTWQIVEQSWQAWEASACDGEDTVRPLHQRLSEIEAHFERVLPLEVDVDTRLDSVSVEGTRLIYRYTRLRGQEPGPSGGVCGNLELRPIVMGGGSIMSHYVDRQGRSLGSILVESCPAEP